MAEFNWEATGVVQTPMLEYVALSHKAQDNSDGCVRCLVPVGSTPAHIANVLAEANKAFSAQGVTPRKG